MRILAVVAVAWLTMPNVSAAQSPDRIRVLVDAFGRAEGLGHDWGYSALVEYKGRRVLFDAGNDSANFAANVEKLGVDLRDLDAVVISHRHGDHTAGLHHLRTVNPDVAIYAPNDEHFGGTTPAVFFRYSDPTLPEEQRYFRGAVPSVVPHGTAWQGLNLLRGAGGTEILPGIRIIENVAPGREFGETPELTLVIDTPEGQVVLVGCSHPGIERILASLEAPSKPVRLVAGGLHLLTTSRASVDRIAEDLRSKWKVKQIAPGHCSGEYAFAALLAVFGDAFLHAGVGESIML